MGEAAPPGPTGVCGGNILEAEAGTPRPGVEPIPWWAHACASGGRALGLQCLACENVGRIRFQKSGFYSWLKVFSLNCGFTVSFPFSVWKVTFFKGKSYTQWKVQILSIQMSFKQMFSFTCVKIQNTSTVPEEEGRWLIKSDCFVLTSSGHLWIGRNQNNQLLLLPNSGPPPIPGEKIK